MSRAWSWRQAIWESDLAATTKIVLQALASHLNDFGDPMFPSQERLAKLCSLSERAVITHLQIAQDSGWIEPRKRALKGKKWAANEYVACWPDGVNDVPRWDEPRSPDGVNDVHTNIPIITSREVSPSVSPQPTKATKRGPTTPISLDKFLQNSGGEPPASFGEYAGSLGWSSIRAGDVWKQFCRYWRSPDAKGGGRKRDWLTTWQNWCDRENGRGGGANGNRADTGLAAALHSSVANRYGASQSGGGVGGGTGADAAGADGGTEQPALAVGEIPF